MTLPVVFTANGPSGYNLTKSLRFRSSASATLSRTPASATNRKTWTFSAWVKRGKLGSINTILNAGYSTIPWFVVNFGSDDTLQIAATAGSSASWKTTAVFRDPAAWYHVVAVVDTTSATTTITSTSTDRMRLYVNNVQQSLSGGTVPTQNSDLQVNNTISHTIGGYSAEYFDGYMAEINFVDGQALTPSSFGSTNALTGVWQPAKYTGTYGTNGFYLPFTNTTSTSTLGTDFSGNSNTWTVNNISLTTGTTYDSMTDVPTLTSATTANYCTLNPLLKGFGSIGTNYTITNGNLTFNGTAGSGNWCGGDGSIGVTSGKWYYECVYTSADSAGDLVAGWVMTQTPRHPGTGANGGAQADTGIGFYSGGGSIYTQGSGTGSCTSWTLNDVMGLAIDVDAKTATIYKNGTSIGTASGLNTGTYWAGIGGYQSYVCQLNFGQRPFTYTPPTGYVALNTYNLPTSTIVKGNTVMDAQLYTGNGSSQTLTTTSGFKPDLVWIKQRSAATGNDLTDTVRGATKTLQSQDTAAEETRANDLTAFTSTGFSVGSGGNVNTNAGTYVAWEWQAGQGTNTSNTSGSITSTVSVNASAGFSVVTWSGNSTIGATVGHGLGVAPSMIIVKQRTGVESWATYHSSLGATKYIDLNGTAGAATSISRWNNTAPSSSVITLYNDSVNNGSGSTYVAYCWSQIAGFSSFGSYTGNGSSDGPFVYTGFRPRFVMLKRSDSTSAWTIQDSARDPENTVDKILYPNYSDAEFSGTDLMDFVSNGFKLRQAGTDRNASGGTYIYMAFAENPFKNALAR
jgi:hypothetical protein